MKELPIVIKIGTQLLTTQYGSIDLDKINFFLKQIHQLRQVGKQVILVSSGAVGFGKLNHPNLNFGKDPVISKQIYASIGQIDLMNAYRNGAIKYDIIVSQVLLSKRDFDNRNHYLTLKNYLHHAVHHGILPILNENDTISVTELMFTDNDELAGLTSAMIGAKRLIILTSVDGIYNGHPEDPKSSVILSINPLQDTVDSFIHPTKTGFGTGGMASKFSIAKKISRLGVETIIANGNRPDILLKLDEVDTPCTRILATHKGNNAKRRILPQSHCEGKIQLDRGASEIVTSGKKIVSILLVGVKKVYGDFHKGDIIGVLDYTGKQLGYGMTQYSSSEVFEMIGTHNKKPVIHYNYLILN